MIGVGSELRGDDGAGPAVVRGLRDAAPPHVALLELDGEAARLIEAWRGRAAVVVVDAVRSRAQPGTVHRLDALAETPPFAAPRTSSHHLGVGEAIALGRALGRLPGRLELYGIEGSRFGEGDALSDPVRAAVAAVTAELAARVRRWAAPAR